MTLIPLVSSSDPNRQAVLQWDGPGQPVKFQPGPTLLPSERLAVLTHLGTEDLGGWVESEDDAGGDDLIEPDPRFPTSSHGALAEALTALAGAAGVRPDWNEITGLESLEVAT